MAQFDDLQFTPLKHDVFIRARWGYYKGISAIYRFANDLGVHVLQYDPNSQPGKALGPYNGTYELRVIRYIDDIPQLYPNNSFLPDVIAQLTPDQITHYMNEVERLDTQQI